ncbi:hypothetical protein [Lentisalinibacter orientalis]|uniref:hypothetical protein n=1 Tax=Lentisalinibacter orientalis TaxID=2992241 RepID=UPI003866228F
MAGVAKNNDTTIIGAVLSGIRAWTGWLGAFAGGMSAISAVVRLIDVGLKPILQDLVGFYRGLIQPLVDLVHLALPWEIPLLAIDLAIVYSVLLGISVRTYYDSRRQCWKFSSHPTDHIRYFLTDLADIISLRPAWTLKPVRNWYSYRNRARKRPRVANPEDEDAQALAEFLFYIDQDIVAASDYRQQLIQFLIVPGALIVFFVLNAY